MRNSLRCPKCRHNRILHITQVADRTGDDSEQTGFHRPEDQSPQVFAKSYPWRLARIPNPKRGFLGPEVLLAGFVEAYVCRQCGFVELYVKDPESIPTDGEIVRELVGPEDSNEPYR